MPRPISNVERVMDEYRTRILLKDADQMVIMSQRWLEVENAIMGRITALTQQAADLTRQGITLSRNRLYRMEHYQALLAQAKAEVDRYAEWSGKTIAANQEQLVTMGIDSAVNTIRASYQDAGQVTAYFGVLPTKAVNVMVGYAGNGTPLAKLLVQDYPQTAVQLTEPLVNGMAMGLNPRVVARNMADAMAGNLDRALTIARTEQLRAFREASRQQMINSGVVTGYTRRCALSARTCEACLALDGTESDTDELMETHPNCRCVAVPIVADLPRIEMQSGEDWFKAQDETTQRDILGPGKFDAWKAGQFEFSQLASTHVDPEWGPTVSATPLSELIQ